MGEWTTSLHSLIKEWGKRQAEERRIVEMFTLAALAKFQIPPLCSGMFAMKYIL